MGVTAILSHLKPSEEGKVLMSHEKAYQKWKKLPKAGDFVKPVSRKESDGIGKNMKNSYQHLNHRCPFQTFSAFSDFYIFQKV